MTRQTRSDETRASTARPLYSDIYRPVLDFDRRQIPAGYEAQWVTEFVRGEPMRENVMQQIEARSFEPATTAMFPHMKRAAYPGEKPTEDGDGLIRKGGTSLLMVRSKERGDAEREAFHAHNVQKQREVARQLTRGPDDQRPPGDDSIDMGRMTEHREVHRRRQFPE